MGAGCGEPVPSRPTSASLTRKGTRVALFVVLTCEWEPCPRPPSWPPPAGAPAAVGQRWSAFAGLGMRRAGGALRLRWRSQGGPPLTGSSRTWGSRALGAPPGCEPPGQPGAHL